MVCWRKRCRNPLLLCVPPVFPGLPDPTGLPAELRPGPGPQCPTGTAAEIRAGASPAPGRGIKEDGGWQAGPLRALWARGLRLLGGSTVQLRLLLLFNQSRLPPTLKLKAGLLLSSEAQRSRRRSHTTGAGWDGPWREMEALQQRSNMAWLTSSKCLSGA